MRPVFGMVAAVLMSLMAIVESNGQVFSPLGYSPWSSGNHYSIGMKKFFNSFTSYQFPNPFPPQQDPLSRLEFPIDQWFIGVISGYHTPSWSLFGQFWTNLNRESALRMQDSDWDDETRPFQKTIFSESDCRLNRSVLFDVGLSVKIPVVSQVEVRPVLGFRYQYFFFTTHDGEQMTLAGDIVDLPGDGIDFKQTFYHYYVGAACRTTVDITRSLRLPGPLVLDVQCDYALVTARNEDLHLLRSGYRVTEENTRGHCWHLAVGLSMLVSDRFTARIDGDFKRLLTNGAHRLTNPLFDLDFSFDGSEVWSDQASISAVGEMSF